MNNTTLFVIVLGGIAVVGIGLGLGLGLGLDHSDDDLVSTVFCKI